MSDPAATPAPAEPTRPCALCREVLPTSAFPEPGAKNCTACREKARARGGVKVPKPEGWVAPKPGETPLKRCLGCQVEKVWSAFPAADAEVCRECVTAPTEPGPQPEAKPEARRPTVYTPELGAAIAEQIAGGATLKAITARPDMPSKDTLARWRLEHEDLAAMLAAARQARADARADDIAELVEAVRTGRVDPQAGRVAIDGLRWLASKDAPGTYGDRVELSNPDGSLKAINAAIAIEALIAALPDLGGGKVQELLPSPATSAGDGAAEAAGAGMAAAVSSAEPEPAREAA